MAELGPQTIAKEEYHEYEVSSIRTYMTRMESGALGTYSTMEIQWQHIVSIISRLYPIMQWKSSTSVAQGFKAANETSQEKVQTTYRGTNHSSTRTSNSSWKTSKTFLHFVFFL